MSGDDRFPPQTYMHQVDKLCRQHLACSWADLCGEVTPLIRAYEDGEEPIDFVRRWQQKYDLEWID